MVLEADEGAALPLRDDVADAAGDVLARVLGPGVEDAQAGQVVAGRRPVVAGEELVAAADGQGGHPLLDGLPERLALHVDEVGGDAPLLAVLAAAHEDEVVSLGVEPVAEVELVDLEVDAARLAAAAQADDVAAVAVEVHQLGVEVSQTYSELQAVSSQ